MYRREDKVVNRKNQKRVVFWHEDVSEKLHCVDRWVQVIQEGSECDVFGGIQF